MSGFQDWDLDYQRDINKFYIFLPGQNWDTMCYTISRSKLKNNG